MKAASVDDLFTHVTLSSLTASAGVRAWVARTIDRDNDGSTSAVWICAIDGTPERLTADGYAPAWDERGERIAFLRMVDGTGQVFVQRRGAAGATQLSASGDGVVSIEHWDSARKRMLCRVTERQDGKAPATARHLPYKKDGLGVVPQERTRLCVLDEETGGLNPAFDSEGDVLEARWSPDGTRLACVVSRSGRQRHRMDLWLQDGHGKRQLTEDLMSISGLDWSPDGTRLAVSASSIEGDSVNWLCVLEVESGKADWPGDIELTIPAGIHWRDDACLIVNHSHRGTQQIVRVDPVGRSEVLWGRQDRQVQDMAVNGGDIVFVAAGVSYGPEIHALQADGTDRALSDFNAWRSQRKAPRATYRGFTVPDGADGKEEVEGWLLLPDGDGPYPLLLDMHGGPHTIVTFEYERYVHWPLLLEKGWAILALNAAGSSSYGRVFAHRIRGRWGELDLPQWRAAVEALQQAGTATDVVACFGHSYGGFLSAWALTHGFPLVCGVVSGGVINQESHTGTSDSGYYVGPYAMDGEQEACRDRYRALSPISYVERIRAPVLLLQGDNDQRCPIGQAEELFAGILRSTQAPAEMLVFPGGTHHVSSTGKPSQRVAYYRRLCEWLEEWRRT